MIRSCNARAVANLAVAQQRTRHALAVGFGVVSVLLTALIALVVILVVHGRWPW